MKGLEILRSTPKYYLSDLGFRQDWGRKLENIIFLELRRRGYQVYTGSIQGNEINFVAEKGRKRLYIQVSDSILNAGTYKREIRSLLQVKDAWPKMLVSLDSFGEAESGIQWWNAADFLLSEKWSA